MTTHILAMAATSAEIAGAAHEDQQFIDATEVSVGIATYLCPEIPGFSAVLKGRFSDFIVHEGRKHQIVTGS